VPRTPDVDVEGHTGRQAGKQGRVGSNGFAEFLVGPSLPYHYSILNHGLMGCSTEYWPDA